MLAELEPTLRRRTPRLHFAQFLLPLRELLVVDRQQRLELGLLRLIQTPLFLEDALLFGIARRRRLEGGAFGQRAQTRLARAQREALRRTLAHAGRRARLIDAQQQLPGLHDLAFLDEDLGHHAAVQRLHDLQLA